MGTDALATHGLDRAQLYDAFLSREAEVPGILDFVEWLSAAHHLAATTGRLADIGCGTGRLLSGFRSLGWEVIGLEPDEDYFRCAQERVGSEPGVSVAQKGFLDLDVVGELDLVVAINGPFCYLLERAQRAEALARIHRALKPGGVLLLDLPNFPYLLKNYVEPAPQECRVGGRRIERRPRHRFDFHRSIWEHEDTISAAEAEGQPYEKLYAEAFRFAILTPPELMHMLRECGFERVDTHASWQSRSSEPLSGPRILLSAQKAS